MASVDVMKVTRANVNGLDVHLDNKKREELNHSNKHINPELTRYNYYVGCKDWDECKKKMDARTAKSDAITPPQRKIKDRIVATMMEIPVPNAIREQGKEDDFLQEAYKQLQKLYGAENVHGMAVHKDEVHQYIDKDGTKKTSLIHAHALVSAYSTWKRKEKVLDENGEPKRDANGKLVKKDVEVSGINGKHFVTRTMLNELHSSFNQMCLEKFGMEYLTHGDARKKSVEELKQESKYAADVVERMAEYEVECKEKLKKELGKKNSELADINKYIKTALKRSETFRNANTELKAANSTLIKENAILGQNNAQKAEQCRELDKQLDDMANDVVLATERIKEKNVEYERNMALHQREQIKILQNSLDYLRMRSQYDKKMVPLRKNMYIPEDTSEWDNTDWECWCLEQKYGSLENAIKAIDQELQAQHDAMLKDVADLEQVSRFAKTVMDEEPELSHSIQRAKFKKTDTVVQNATPEQVKEVFELSANMTGYLQQQQIINERMLQEIDRKEKDLLKREKQLAERKKQDSLDRKIEIAKAVSDATNQVKKEKNFEIKNLKSELSEYKNLEQKYPDVKDALAKARGAELKRIALEQLKEVAGTSYKRKQKEHDEWERE